MRNSALISMLFVLLLTSFLIAELQLIVYIDVGLAWAGPVRQFLEIKQFEGMAITWIEQKKIWGLGGSLFILKGGESDVLLIVKVLNATWKEKNDEKLLGVNLNPQLNLISTDVISIKEGAIK